MVQYVGLDYDNIRELFNDCGVTVIDLTYEHESGLMMHSIACPCDVDGFDTFRVRYKADDLDNPIYMELINYDYDAIMELCGNPKESPIMLNEGTIRSLLDDFEEMQFLKMEHRTVKDVLTQMHQSVGVREFIIGFDDSIDSYYCALMFDNELDNKLDCVFEMWFYNEDVTTDYEGNISVTRSYNGDYVRISMSFERTIEMFEIVLSDHANKAVKSVLNMCEAGLKK